MTVNRFLHILTLTSAMVFTASAQNVAEGLRIADTKCNRVESEMVLSAVIRLDSLRLATNNQLFITPVLTGPDHQRTVFPSVPVNGRNMHYVYERSGLTAEQRKSYSLLRAVRRHNGKAESIDYLAKVPAERWMKNPATTLAFTLDTCGCGVNLGSVVGNSVPVAEDPAKFLAEKEDEYNKLFCNPYNAAKYGYIDDVIEPRNTRFRIIRALQQLATKKLTNPAKKHGNIPL